jgi:hypothetical protein
VPCVVSSPTHPTDSSDLRRDCCKEHCIGARDNRLLADIGELCPAAGNELSDDSTDLDGEGPALVLPGCLLRAPDAGRGRSASASSPFYGGS